VHFVVVGVGVNLNLDGAEFPAELKETATSLSLARKQKVPRALFTAALWTKLEEWLDRHAAEGFEPVRAEWKALSSTLGQDVLVRTERSELRGIAEDIDESGALLVKTFDGKVEKVLAGDVEQLRSRKE
jgi:BirA family biotin operon repressor/biotin-[acetyl-CoA-carboxylase] ligase